MTRLFVRFSQQWPFFPDSERTAATLEEAQAKKKALEAWFRGRIPVEIGSCQENDNVLKGEDE